MHTLELLTNDTTSSLVYGHRGRIREIMAVVRRDPRGVVLYIGQIGYGETCRDRMLALQDLGFEVHAFDTTPYLTAPPRIARSIGHRYNIGHRIGRLNADLQGLRADGRAPRLVWVDKGKWIRPDTLLELRRTFGCPLVHFTPDPQLQLHKSRHFRACVPHYDVVVTTKVFEVDDYRRAGAQRVILTGQAYDERRAGSAARRQGLASDVCFIGHCESHYRRTLSHVPRKSVTFKVWGRGWTRTARDYVKGGGLWGPDYYDGLASAKIALGLLSKRIPETSTTRTFEIPATGALLLAERTDEHENYFVEGKEAEFFDDLEEMRDKIRFFVHNDFTRTRVARAGKQTCIRAGYGNRARLRRLLAALDEERDYHDLRFIS